MQNLEVIAQLMLDNSEDYCEIQENNGTILLGRFYENAQDVIYLCKDNNSCNMDEWVKIQRIK